MSGPSTSGLSVGLLLRVIDVKYGCLLYFTLMLNAYTLQIVFGIFFNLRESIYFSKNI